MFWPVFDSQQASKLENHVKAEHKLLGFSAIAIGESLAIIKVPAKLRPYE
jgi:hypothetical protein